MIANLVACVACRRPPVLFLLLSSFLLALQEAIASERIALVIGNNAYSSAPLENPIRDARAVARALGSLGFSVVELNDATKSELESTVMRLRDRLRGSQDVGMVFYAGHAIQLNWRNYLVPVDAALRRPQDVPTQTVDVQMVLDAFKEAGNRMNILVLDACRNNPFGTIPAGSGLVPIDAPWGTFLAYSTSPGAAAEDGSDGGNSLYTKYLVQELSRPTPRIEDVFKRVRFQVRQRTEGRQIPWESTSLEEEFHFDKGVLSSGQPDFKVRREDFAAEETAWNGVKDSREVAQLFAFLQKYPSGAFSEAALNRVNVLQAPSVPGLARPEPAPGPSVLAAPSRRRYEVGDRFVYKRSVNLRRAEVTPLHLEVTWVDDNLAIWNNFAMDTDQLGTIQRVAYRSFPGVDAFPETFGGAVEFAVGRRWRQAMNYDGGRFWLDLDYRVVAREEVQVPAGRFQTYRIEATGIRDDARGGRSSLRRTIWVDSETTTAVKLQFRDQGRTLERDELLELASMSRAAR